MNTLAPTLQLFLAMIVAGAGASLGWHAMAWLFHTIIRLIEGAAARKPENVS